MSLIRLHSLRSLLDVADYYKLDVFLIINGKVKSHNQGYVYKYDDTKTFIAVRDLDVEFEPSRDSAINVVMYRRSN